MTLSISGTKRSANKKPSAGKKNPELTRRRAKRSAVVGLSLTLLCGIFTVIYEHFSHNAASNYMRSMFLMPLLGVCLPGLVGYITPLHRYVGRVPFNLWNSAMAVWTVGCLFRGIVNISGRYTSLDKPYWIAGWVFIGLSLVCEILYVISVRQRKQA